MESHSQENELTLEQVNESLMMQIGGLVDAALRCGLGSCAISDVLAAILIQHNIKSTRGGSEKGIKHAREHFKEMASIHRERYAEQGGKPRYLN